MKTEKKGFTLLEVMAAVSLMAIVLTAVYRLHSQTISMSSSARFYTNAPLLAQRTMSELETKPDEFQGNSSGDYGEEFPGYSWTVSVEDVESEELGEAAKDLKRIDVRVTLNEGELNYSFRTYRLMPEEK
ncbi:MAG: prepilin-type N-terminal cleavage/methylation domain-containing protein [Desulfobacterales bacterium]